MVGRSFVHIIKFPSFSLPPQGCFRPVHMELALSQQSVLPLLDGVWIIKLEFFSQLRGRNQCLFVYLFARTSCLFSPDGKMIVTGTSVKKAQVSHLIVNLVLSTGLINVNWPLQRDSEADV